MSDRYEVQVNPIQLFVAKQALEVYIKWEGRMELTRTGGNASQSALRIISGVTGKTYKRSMNGKREALSDVLVILEAIETQRETYFDEAGRLVLA